MKTKIKPVKGLTRQRAIEKAMKEIKPLRKRTQKRGKNI